MTTSEQTEAMADPSQWLRKSYIVALAILALLTICGEVYVQSVIVSQSRDSEIINVAGRQRMLSQRLAKSALAMHLAETKTQFHNYRMEFEETLSSWEESHQHLFGGAGITNPIVSPNEKLEAALEELQPHYQSLRRDGRETLEKAAKEEPIDLELAEILASERAFLPLMHQIVGLLEAEAIRHLQILKRVQMALMISSLAALVLIAIFVFEPAARTLKRHFQESIGAAVLHAEAKKVQAHNVALGREVDKRKQTEEQLRARVAEIEKLTLIASRTRHSVVITDPAGRIEYVNDSFTSMTGYRLEDVEGKRPGSFLQGTETDPETVAIIRDHIRRKEYLEIEIVNYSKIGNPYWVLLEIEPFFDANGTLQNFIGTQTDITDRKRDELMLQAAKDQAEKANESKSQFLTNMSHEIRTPLNSILGYTEMLLRGGFDAERRYSHLRSINSSGKHLLALINDILDLSKIESGEMKFHVEACSPRQIIGDVLSMLRVGAYEKGLSLDCEWLGQVPETIRTDPQHFRQLLMNLVGNAIKFTESGHVRVTASVDSAKEEPKLVVDVSDTGIGIQDQFQSKIFETFSQADNSITRRFGGTGLGLAISRHIAEELGGEITLKSKLGVGSTFQVTLPTGSLEGVKTIDGPVSESIQSFEATGVVKQMDLAKARVLLCEDGEANRDLIGLVLNDAGAAVTYAENGQQGIEVIEQHSGEFDLVLMDMQMPVMDGYSATAKLRQTGWKKPIIALTAHAMQGDEDKCRTAGCSGYLTKPIEIDRLLETVHLAVTAVHQNNKSNGESPSPASEFKSPELEDCPMNKLRKSEDEAIYSTLPIERAQFRTIVEKFVQKLDEQLDSMRAALAESNFEKLAEQAHWLKGAGGTMGFDCFTPTARDLEMAAKSEESEIAESMLEVILSLQSRIELPDHSEAGPHPHSLV